ncbi:MAG TPA: DUF4149 domain-containing protein [Chloroflexia bacterium]|nr:DUF4149 domain-containing protein [Chloroflexia bacterium]
MGTKSFAWLVGIEGLLFALLEGSMFTLGLIVGPGLFKVVTSRDLAGRAFGQMLQIWLWIGFGGIILLLVTAAITFLKVRPVSRLLLARLVLLMLSLALTGVFSWLVFRITDLQNSLTKPLDDYPADVNPRLEIDQVHKLSTNVLSGVVILVFAWFVLSVIAFTRFKVQPAVKTGVVARQAQDEPASPLASV